jgi:NDP-hexose-3-ketoreductase
MPEALRVIIAGLGKHATQTVIPAVAAARGWVLAGVVSARRDAATTAGRDLEVAAYGDIEAAIAAERPDAVYLATTPADHGTACAAALNAGVRLVICEKPLVVDAGEARDLVATSRRNGVPLVEVMAYQHHPQFAAMKGVLASEEFGGLAHGYARFSYPDLAPGDHRYRAAAGGGALLDAGVYPISLAVELMGTADLEVQGALASRGDAEVDTAGTATLLDADGRAFQISWEMGAAYANLARFVGRSESLEVERPFSKPESFAEPLTVIGGWGERRPVEYSPANQFVAMLDHVAANVGDAAWADDMRRRITDRWAVISRIAG